MKKYSAILTTIVALSSSLLLVSQPVVAEEGTLSGDGTVNFEGEYTQEVYDPENPENVVDPGESPKTNGNLRIDFVPQLNFGKNQVTQGKRQFQANAQLFLDETKPRGNFVQVSDYRGTGGGWTLQVRQESQFVNDQTLNNELKGAVISFDKSWTNSSWSKDQAPTVSKDIIRIENIGETYNLADAKSGTGEGSWAIEFGASADNQVGQSNTLSPLTDKNNEPVTDPLFNNQPIYKNSAVTLSIPEITKIDPVPYQTVLTWILSELP